MPTGLSKHHGYEFFAGSELAFPWLMVIPTCPTWFFFGTMIYGGFEPLGAHGPIFTFLPRFVSYSSHIRDHKHCGLWSI